ncbi:MAG: HYR domain-containing protein, partial [Flavobacteriales bacterium]|nr:HYR domain-containing protein [Flavobacteriales bacterium]
MAPFGSLQFHSTFTRTERTGSVALLLCLLFTSTARAQGPIWNWAATYDAGNTEFVRDIAVEPGTGNFYAVGAYRSSTSTAASYALPASVGGSLDAFLAKLDPSGNVLWSRAFGSTQEDAALGVSVASNGTVVITGYYGAPIAGIGLTNAGSQDAFIVAYDGTGAFQWARSVTGPQREEGTSIVISGNTVVAYGSFTYNSTNTNGVLATSGLNNNRSYAYLNAYDLTGAVLWSITGVSDDDLLTERIATDGTNVYVVGSTKGYALSWRNSLGSSSTTVTTADNEALFCSAIRLSGSVVWARMINNPDDSDVECNGVAVDCGNVYITGRTNNNSLFPGGIIPTGPGSDDYWFLAALSNSTGSTNWVRTASSSIDHGVTGYDVSVGRNGQIHVAGTLAGTMTTDGGTVIGGGSAYDLLISRFNSDGTAVWHHRATSPDNELAFAIAPLGGGRIVVGGEYENGLTLGSSTYPGSNGSNLFTASFTDPDWVNLSNNPARFALPGPFCSSVGPLDLNNYLQAYASVATGSSNVASPTEATGAPNGVGSQFNTTNGWVVLDMRDTVLVGEAVQLVWRSQTTGVQARMLVSSSLDGVNWTTASTYNTTSATYGTVTYPLASNARFIRVQRHSSSTYTSFHLDAVRYYGSTLPGGTWSGGPHVTAAGIFTATTPGSYPVTYTVVLGACTYTYTRSIVVNPGPTGTITGPIALCSGATGTWTLSAPVGTTIAWQRSTNGGALWSTFANDVASVSGVLGQPTMFRALLSNASCPTPVATNTIETVPGDTQGPTLPPLADIVRRTATGRCDTVVSFATPVVTDNCTTCDPGTINGYTRLGVFEGHAYYLSTTTSYWPDANSAAQAMGGHLVSISSLQENAWLASQIAGLIAYIGLNDTQNEGQFVWSNGEPVDHTNWSPGQPDNGILGLGNQDWGTINGGPSGLWDDEGGLLALQRPHIVEFDCAIWQSAGPTSGSAFPVGSTTVTFSASDLAGNTSSRSFEVTVEDVVPPTFTQCPGNLILPLGAGCAARVPNLIALASATDDCSAVVMGQVPESNDIITSDSLAYIVAKDVYGNTDTCWVQLSVQDQTAPTLFSCPGDITVNVPLAQLDMAVSYIPPTASDNCAVVWNGQTDGTGLTSGSAFPIGTTQQRWSFRDAAGNISTCSFEVTVLANDAPQLLCPMFAPVVTDAGQCSALVNHTPPVAFDAQDGNLTAMLVPPSLPSGPFPIGTSTVTYRVQDLDGNVASCSFNVTVVDGEAPTITCPPSQTLNSAITECSTFVSWPAPVVADNCPSCIPTAALSSYILLGIHDGKQYYLKNDPETYDGAIAAAQSMGYHLLSIGTPEENDFVLASINAVGVDPVWIGLTDEVTEGTFLWHSGEPLLYQNWAGVDEPNNWGNEDAVMMTSTGQWNDVPVDITLPYIIEVPCFGLDLYQTGGPTSGSAFPVNTTNISYTVIDAAGRSADCTFSITVVDSIPPIFSNCPANDTLTLPGHDCTMAYILPTVFSDDGNACDTDTENGYRTEVLLSEALTPLDITGWSNLALPHGTHRFRETHTDDAGNQATCEWSVTVEDVMHPEVVSLLTDSFPLYLDGACSIAFPDLRTYVTATDCNGATIDMWPLPGTLFTGETLVQMTMVVKDSLGNSVPNNHSIWIHDNTPPTVTCPDTLFFPATTSCLGNVLIPGPTNVFDNCGVPSWTVDANNGLWPVGDSTITYTVTDGRNSATCATVIRVLDGTPAIPTISTSGPTTFCSGGNVTLTSSSATGNLWSNGATTNSITVNTGGNYTVTVTDANGCSATSATTTVVVNPTPVTPVITASGSTTFCSGGSVTLTSSSATGNLWSNGATSNSITVNTGGNYTVTVTDANGCSATSATTTVVVNPAPVAPVITASGPTTFCSGGTVTLTSSSAAGNLWSNGATTPSITVSTPGNYAVTVTDANG